MMLQYTAYIILLAFLLRIARATSSSEGCEKTNDVLKCSCLFEDFSDCATHLFTILDSSGISKLHINCGNGNLSLAYFTPLAEGVRLADLTIVQCELTDWHTTEALPTALSGLKSLTITQSFSTAVFPNFGDMFQNLQNFTFYNNNLNHDNVPNVQQFHFAFENAVVCISQSDATATRKASNDTGFIMHNRSCFCTFVNKFVQFYCFGAHTLDLKNAMSAVANTPQYIHPSFKKVTISAIGLHNLQFLINDSPDSNFTAILNEIAPSVNFIHAQLFKSHGLMFKLDTCEQIGNITNATDAWKELQGLLCPFYFGVSIIGNVSVVNCPQANALQLVDNIVAPGSRNCGMLQGSYLQYLDLSNNNITMEQYVAHFPYQVVSEHLTVFNFSGNNLGILKPMFFYLINPFNLRHVDLSYSNVTSVQDNPFDYLDNVEWMSLAANSLQYVQYYWFRDRLKLKYLDLSNNPQLNGVWGPGRTYPQIWPERLEHLDLSGTNLVDADDLELIATFGVRFTDKFFMGLSNLLVLNLSYSSPVLSADLFKPLRSLQVLDLTGSLRVAYPSRFIPKDMLEYLAHLRSLYMGEVLSSSNEIYSSTCEFFQYTAMLGKLDLKRSNFNDPTIDDSPPNCVDLLGLYSWVQWKRRDDGNFTFLEDDQLLCAYNETQYSFVDMQALIALYSIDFDLSLTFKRTTSSNFTTVAPIDDRSLPDPPSPQPSQWTQMQLPLFVCLAIVFVVIFLCIPTRVIFPACLPGKYNPDTSRKSESDLSKFEAKPLKDKRKELKQSFFEETLINGFLFAHRSHMMVERLAWYAVILAFTGILIFQIIGLWQQFYYSDPSTQSTMVSAAKFPQNSFTLCFPIEKRNHYELTKADVYSLAAKPLCDQNDGLSLPMHNSMLRDMVMYRIGAQMAWEGGSLKHNLTITEALKAMDDIVFGRNLTYRNLLTEVNGLLCEVTNFTASMRAMDDSDDHEITVNSAGCADLLEQQGFGLTWYDLVETDTACMRFPGLFNFSGFQQEGMLQFQPWQFFYSHTAAKIDLGGYEYPLAAGPNSYPARANLHHDTSMVIQLKSVYRNLPTYRSKTNRCYKNCIGTKRVAEIQATCKCRPLMFADFSDPTLPDCTLDTYKKCGLSKNGDLRAACADAVPCELWDFGVSPTDNGLTPDNSTIIRFAGMNTLYVVYEEQDARTAINFMGDVGGVLGLWLGGSLVAIVHIFFFCLKSIYWLVPWFGGRKCGDKNRKTASEAYQM